MSVNFLNEARPYEVGAEITEWDMKRAGISLCKEFQLLPTKEIEKIEKMEKHDADVYLGKRQIKDPNFSKSLEKAFTDAIHLFLDRNQIDQDLDVISIKKDACFIINKHISESSFGDYIYFRPKNTYHAYLRIAPYELYFQRDGSIDIKGLTGDKSRRKKILQEHEDGMINLLQLFIETAEKYGERSHEVYRLLHSFCTMYKEKELDFPYYREFNIESKFKYENYSGSVMVDDIDESMLQYVDISYNYLHWILPMIQLCVS